MCTLNRAAAEVLAAASGVHACTDITGFGLIGHAVEMATGSGVSIEIRAGAVPLFEGVLPLVSRHRSGGMATNRAHFASRVTGTDGLDRDLHDLLYDPQTSGGLLIAVAEDHASALQASLSGQAIPFWTIGRVPEHSGPPQILVI